MEYILGMEPCAFCIYERWPYAIVGILSLIAIAHHQERFIIFYLGLIAIAFFINTLLSAYHIAIEQHWVPLPSVCGGGRFAINLSFEEVKEVLLNQRIVPCDQAPIKIFGLSMATYNGILSAIVGMKTVCFMTIYHQQKK